MLLILLLFFFYFLTTTLHNSVFNQSPYAGSENHYPFACTYHYSTGFCLLSYGRCCRLRKRTSRSFICVPNTFWPFNTTQSEIASTVFFSCTRISPLYPAMNTFLNYGIRLNRPASAAQRCTNLQNKKTKTKEKKLHALKESLAVRSYSRNTLNGSAQCALLKRRSLFAPQDHETDDDDAV